MARPVNLEVRSRLLSIGRQVVHNRGFNGCGVQDITAAAEIPKGSFYNYFASKEDFALQALAFIYRPRLARYAQALNDPALSPRTRILAYYRDLLAHFARQDTPQYHCFIGSLSFEMSEMLPAIGAEVAAIQQASVDILRDCLEQAQAAGELPTDEDCGNLATFISDAWQGVLARLKVGRNLQPLEAFITRLERLLQA